MRPTSRTHPCRSGLRELPCSRCPAPSRAGVPGPWPLFSFWPGLVPRAATWCACSLLRSHRWCAITSRSPRRPTSSHGFMCYPGPQRAAPSCRQDTAAPPSHRPALPHGVPARRPCDVPPSARIAGQGARTHRDQATDTTSLESPVEVTRRPQRTEVILTEPPSTDIQHTFVAGGVSWLLVRWRLLKRSLPRTGLRGDR